MLRKSYILQNLVSPILAKRRAFEVRNLSKIELLLSDADQRRFDLKPVTAETFEEKLGIGLDFALRLMGERDLPKEQRLKHQRRLNLLDGACKIGLLGILLWYFPYEGFYHFVSAALLYLPNMLMNMYKNY